MVNAVDVGCETPGVFGVLGEMEAVGTREKIKTNTQKRCQRNNHAPKKTNNVQIDRTCCY